MKIGIPRALFYWKKSLSIGVDGGHFWETFFENLGLEVILSPESNKEIVKRGLKISDPEACFATKVFFGHILWLDQKGVDYIFVPRLKTSDEKLEYCPKFFGIPELTKISVKTKILTETFDAKKNHHPSPTLPSPDFKDYHPPTTLPSLFSHPKKEIPAYFKEGLRRLGKKLKINNEKIEKAMNLAFSNERKLKEKQKQNFLEKIKSKKQKIVLISHPYNLYDDYVNVGIKQKLEKLGAEVIFIDDVPTNSRIGTNTNTNHTNNICEIRGELVEIRDYPEFHWEFGKEIMEKIQEILKYELSGAVEISSFLCGCDAVLKEFVEKIFKKNKIPFLYLIIDEHTADAGIQTRLEAFIDTLK